MSEQNNNLPLSQEQIAEFVAAARVMNAENVELSGDSLEMFRNVMSRRPPTSLLENREYNSHDDPDSEAKQRILEDFTSEIGCCYLQLICASDTILRLSVGKFAMFLLYLRNYTGKFPLSIDASQCVAQRYAFWVHKLTEEEEEGEIERYVANRVAATALSIQEEMMQSGARFKLIETSAGFHLSATTFGPCGCPNREVLCHHGWAARYPLCAIIKEGRRLGGTELDFEDFFSSVGEEEQGPSARALYESREKLERLERVHALQKEMEENTRQSQRNMERVGEEFKTGLKSLNNPQENTERLAEMTQRFNQESKKSQLQLEQALAQRDECLRLLSLNEEDNFRPNPLKFGQRTTDTIVADDSASSIGLNFTSGRFMEQGTVVSDATLKIGRKNLGRVVNSQLPGVPESAIGFVQTEELYAGDVAARQGVIPINGLSKPFSNSRLNLLGHIYTGLNIVNRESESQSFFVTLLSLRKSKLNSPPVQLFRQVLNCTFDWEESMVKSNPFGLPYIEVGMTISEDSLIKCFELLNSEYKNLWFSEMKQMQVPSFAQDYNHLSDFSIKGSKRNSLLSGSKTSESYTDDKASEASSRSRDSHKQRKSSSSRKDSGSSSRSSVLGFPLR
jgi:hypothetical protein